jgi:hypothetical protein
LLTVLWMAGDGLGWLLRRRTPAAKATVKALQPDSRSCSGQGPGARPLSSGTSSRPCPARAAAGTRPTGTRRLAVRAEVMRQLRGDRPPGG